MPRVVRLDALAGGVGGSWYVLMAGLARLDAVYRIVRAICEHAERVRRIHPAASGFDPGVAHRLSRGPLHPGAAKYFREAGLLT